MPVRSMWSMAEMKRALEMSAPVIQGGILSSFGRDRETREAARHGAEVAFRCHHYYTRTALAPGI